jgi:hypothetical protein
VALGGLAGLIVNAATRTALGSGSFGDNFVAAILDAIGQTIGAALANSQDSQLSQLSPTDVQNRMNIYNAALDGGTMTSDQLDSLYHFLGLDAVTSTSAPLGPSVEVYDLPPPNGTGANAEALSPSAASSAPPTAAATAAPVLTGDALAKAYSNVADVTYKKYAVTPSDSSGPDDTVAIQIATMTGGDPQAIITQLQQLPEAVLSFVNSNGIKFVAVANSVTQYMTQTAGYAAEGGDGRTYDTVTGTFDYATNAVVIATNATVNSEGSTDLVLHELGHAIDYNFNNSFFGLIHGGYESQSSTFVADYNAANAARPFTEINGYFNATGNPQEYMSEAFAESFAANYSTNPGQFGNAYAAWSPTPFLTNRPTLTTFWKNVKW